MFHFSDPLFGSVCRLCADESDGCWVEPDGSQHPVDCCSRDDMAFLILGRIDSGKDHRFSMGSYSDRLVHEYGWAFVSDKMVILPVEISEAQNNVLVSWGGE